MRYQVMLLFLIGCFFNTSAAQKDTLTVKIDTLKVTQKKIDQSELIDFRDNPDFDYEVLNSGAPDWWVSLKNWISNLILQFFEWIFGVEKASGVFNVFLRILPYLLLLLLVFILIKFFINVNARALMYNRKEESLVTLSEEEHIIKNEDIQVLINKALEQKNYRLAIRYYYLFTLRLMNQKEIILWELQKTNADYQSEIKKVDLKKPFANITRLYEYIWYGDFPIDESQYLKAEANFLSLKNTLQNG